MKAESYRMELAPQVVWLQAEVCKEAVEEHTGGETEAAGEMRGEHNELAVLRLWRHLISGRAGGYLHRRRDLLRQSQAVDVIFGDR